MNLLLSSGGNSSLNEEQISELHEHIKNLFKGVQRVLFISYAQKNQKEYTKKIKENWWPLDDVELIGIEEFENPVEAILDSEGIYVGGGNTFLLTKILQEKNLINPLRNVVIDGVPYMGVSAGTNIACPSMKTTNDMPVVKPKSFQTLGLIDFQINAHHHKGNIWYKDGESFKMHRGETRAQRISEYHEFNDLPVIGLSEGSAIWWKDGRGQLLIGGASIFIPNKEPKNVKIGSNIDKNLDLV
jgi:dipeptidase E